MTNLNTIILMMGQGEGKGGGIQTIIMMVLIVGVFYFFMIRPQMKKRKEQANFRNEMQKGDKVMTMGGIYGKISQIKDSSVIIEVEGQGRIKVLKDAIVKDASGVMIQK